jgi:hypothetical protein
MKRRELLMLVASGGSVLTPAVSSGSEQTLDDLVTLDGADATAADPDVTGSEDPGAKSGDDPATVEVTIELY